MKRFDVTTKVATSLFAYRRGGFAARVSRMGDDEFKKYETALRIRFDLPIRTMSLVRNCLRVGLICSVIMFVAYCLLFVLLFRKPIMTGLVASLIAGLIVAMVGFVSVIRHQIVENDFHGVKVSDLGDMGLADATRQATHDYEDIPELLEVAEDLVRWFEYAEKRYGEITRLADVAYADDTKARERLHAVADIEYLVARYATAKSFGQLDGHAKRFRENGENIVSFMLMESPSPSSAAEQRIRRELLLTTSDLPAIEPRFIDELDYTKLVLEMKSRGIPVGCKEGDERYAEAKEIADGICEERDELASASTTCGLSDIDMLSHLELWDDSDRKSDDASEETDE